jgi:predicted transcriptional regulator
MADTDGKRGRGDLAREILHLLDTAGVPLTPPQVRTALGGDLAYTTVMTVMARLRAKGFLARQRSGRTYAYTLLRDPARVTARRMHRLLEVEPDRGAILARFVDDLSSDDEATLRALLNQTPPGGPP